MRRLLLALGITLALAIPAQAHHVTAHHCKARPHTHSRQFYAKKAHAKNVPAWQVRRNHRHHAHTCAISQYPPQMPLPTTLGERAAFATEPVTVGVTVGLAALIALVGMAAGFAVGWRVWR